MVKFLGLGLAKLSLDDVALFLAAWRGGGFAVGLSFRLRLGFIALGFLCIKLLAERVARLLDLFGQLLDAIQVVALERLA